MDPMRLRADQVIVAEWAERAGGIAVATEQIRKALKCSHSKANKMACGVYPFALSPFEQDALLKLIPKSRDVLFPAGKRAKSAS